MRILVDENIPLKTVAALNGNGHDVLDVRGTPEQGVDDATLWQIAQRQKRLLVTTDKGFAQRRYEPHHGVVIVRLRQPNRERIHRRVMDAVTLVPEHDWNRLLVTMRDRLHSLWRPGNA
jgi:predicted nuclease of predicted toxin-antitoxin system